MEGAIIWISAGEFAPGKAQHGPRIMLMLGEKITTEGLRGAASIRLTSPPEVLGVLPGKVERGVVRFATLNRDVLPRHWGGELDARKTLDRLQRG